MNECSIYICRTRIRTMAVWHGLRLVYEGKSCYHGKNRWDRQKMNEVCFKMHGIMREHKLLGNPKSTELL